MGREPLSPQNECGKIYIKFKFTPFINLWIGWYDNYGNLFDELWPKRKRF